MTGFLRLFYSLELLNELMKYINILFIIRFFRWIGHSQGWVTDYYYNDARNMRVRTKVGNMGTVVSCDLVANQCTILSSQSCFSNFYAC